MTTKEYHLFYNEDNLNKKAIEYLRLMIKRFQFFKQDDITKLNLLKKLGIYLSKIYGIPKIRNLTLEYGFKNIGCYNSHHMDIVLNKCSLITFLHEYKHHINNCLNLPNTEDSARGYSHSMFYLATPDLFINSCNKGLIVYQNSINTTNNK